MTSPIAIPEQGYSLILARDPLFYLSKGAPQRSPKSAVVCMKAGSGCMVGKWEVTPFFLSHHPVKSKTTRTSSSPSFRIVTVCGSITRDGGSFSLRAHHHHSMPPR